MSVSDFAAVAWPRERLGQAWEELSSRSGLTRRDSSSISPRWYSSDETPGDWLERAAQQSCCEAEPLYTTARDLETTLARCAPALIELHEQRFLVVTQSSERKLQILTPELANVSVNICAVCDALLNRSEEGAQSALATLLGDLDRRKRERVLQAILQDHSPHRRMQAGWAIRLHPGARSRTLLRKSGCFRLAGGFVAAHLSQYGLWIASWAVLGSLSFAGHLDRGWLLGWALLLLTIAPCQILNTFLQGRFAVAIGAFLKRRILYGALRLEPEEMRTSGIGSFIGQALEAEEAEALALSGGIAGTLALLEIFLAGFVLGPISMVLAVWISLLLLAGWRFFKEYERWTEKRLALSGDLVESMVGHRTRLAQLPREEWHCAEDRTLREYLAVSRHLDGMGAWLAAAVPRGWLITGLLALSPGVVTGRLLAVQTAVKLGGILLAYSAFRRLAESFAEIAAAATAWRKLLPVLQAAGRSIPDASSVVKSGCASQTRLLEAQALFFRYPKSSKSALQDATLTIYEGDRVLLEGGSGGGKTTFASLLSGLRQPASGLLLLKGLDLKSVGEAQWRKHVVSVPQFHQNHLLTETLAFNLLLGREWPPTKEDMTEAETVCRELGLGLLLEAMPGGLMQMVGEGGWQLSHGEKSRVFMARALLQNADLVILDESFAALDPANARQSLECFYKCAKSLMVIAHP